MILIMPLLKSHVKIYNHYIGHYIFCFRYVYLKLLSHIEIVRMSYLKDTISRTGIYFLSSSNNSTILTESRLGFRITLPIASRCKVEKYLVFSLYFFIKSNSSLRLIIRRNLHQKHVNEIVGRPVKFRKSFCFYFFVHI